jgi:hypothetical protein
MIKRVRRSFIKITMTMMSLVLLVPLCALNIITAAVTYNQTHQILQQIAQAQVELLAPPVEEENGGKPDLPMEEEAPTVQTTTAPCHCFCRCRRKPCQTDHCPTCTRPEFHRIPW